MESIDIIKQVQQYNKTLVQSSCTNVEKSYIREIERHGYFYGFSFTITNLPKDVESFLEGQKYFRGLLKDNHQKLCEYLRQLHHYTCNTNVLRMSVRSNNFANYVDKVVKAIGAFYLFYGSSMNLKDLIYGSYRQVFYNFDFAPIITVELLQGNGEVIQYCKDVLLSENNTAILTRDVIIAIEQSNNHELLELLKQVFLAAKLQEGLRQAVIETVDENNFSYFLEMVEVIAKENLLRYASIQRGILTWIGIGYQEVKEKDVRYIFEHLQEYFKHETIRQSALVGTNPLNSYLALYCKGAINLEAAINEACQLLKSKQRHLVACGLVYLKLTRCLDLKEYDYFMDEYHDDEWIMALYYSEWSYHNVKELNLSEEQAINLFNHLNDFVAKMKSHKIYTSKGFDWLVLSLDKYQLCQTMFEVIKEYPLPALVEGYLPYVASTLSDRNLDYFIENCFDKVSDKIKKSFMIKEIISSNNKLAKAIEQEFMKFSLSKTEMLALEGRLKTKKGTARAHIVNVLANQEKQLVKESYQRLLASTQKNIKESALEMKKKKPEYFGSDDNEEIVVKGKEDGFGLYTPYHKHIIEYSSHLKVVSKGLLKKSLFVDFSEMFPLDKKQVLAYLKLWNQRITAHENDEYYTGYEYRQVKNKGFWPLDYQQNSLSSLPLSEVWKTYFDEDKLSEDVIFEIVFLCQTVEDDVSILDYLKVKTNLFTLTDEDIKDLTYYNHMAKIFEYYFKEFESDIFMERARMYLELIAKFGNPLYYTSHIYNTKQCHPLTSLRSYLFMENQLEINQVDDEQFKQSYALLNDLYNTYNIDIDNIVKSRMTIMPHLMARAVNLGLLPLESLYEGILDTHLQNDERYYYNRNGNLLFEAYRDAYFEGKGWGGKPNFDLENYHHQFYCCDFKVIELLREALNTIAGTLVKMEATRLNETTAVTYYVNQLKVICGVEYLIKALHVLSGEGIKRLSYGDDRNTVFTNVIRNCYPIKSDSPDDLKKENFSEETLVEVAMLAPQWIDFINQVLNWDGFKEASYYFIAHMRQYDYDQKKATIAKYTQLDPLDLNDGAFDLDWCKEVHHKLGDKRFKMIYKASKFLCDNSFHSRARKYADACLGKISKEELLKQVNDKRNKDSLNAYCICPINNDHDLLERYQVIQQFLKESRKFGSQRQASEKRACEIALLNLARNSKYQTPTRLLWMMENEMFEQYEFLLKPQIFDNVELWIEIDENGKNQIMVNKNGKKQKSIPASLRKNEQVLLIKDIHNKWNEQYRRSKQMLQQAMEEKTYFADDEIRAIMNNPIVAPMISKLVLVSDGYIGFYHQGELKTLTDTVALGKQIRIAHPYDLYIQRCWHDYQKLLFSQKIVQPFKQIFRELYLKLDDELEQSISKRYSGYQIQTKKAAAALKSRKWNISYETGLEKICYHDDLVVNLYAQADWFSPSDIEAPSIDYVSFSTRRDNKAKLIKEIDGIAFSETMRDLDLAVSVSYVGGVDPITSFSTMELRKTIVEYTCQLMKLKNVTVQDHFINISGSINDYSVHLGSGVIHQSGGAMINVITVLSGKRGKVYLPFLDEDPKTAEIISKVIMLAEDHKIKDPSILNQISSRKMEV